MGPSGNSVSTDRALLVEKILAEKIVVDCAAADAQLLSDAGR